MKALLTRNQVAEGSGGLRALFTFIGRYKVVCLEVVVAAKSHVALTDVSIGLSIPQATLRVV